jgi:hypothetical protein
VRRTGLEVGVHFGVTVGNATYASDNKPEYRRLVPTADPSAEATRLIHLMKVKETPSTTSYNNTMVPIMTVSETDRSRLGGLLAMTELYLIKYGDHTFDQAFVNANNPHFVGAKTNGGAKALKHIDREHRNVQPKPSQKMTMAQRSKLHGSVSRFVERLHGPRGRSRPSKFAGARTKAEVLARVTTTLVRRAGYPPAQAAQAAVAIAAKVTVKTPTKTTLTTPAKKGVTKSTHKSVIKPVLPATAKRKAAVKAALLIKKQLKM